MPNHLTSTTNLPRLNYQIPPFPLPIPDQHQNQNPNQKNSEQVTKFLNNKISFKKLSEMECHKMIPEEELIEKTYDEILDHTTQITASVDPSKLGMSDASLQLSKLEAKYIKKQDEQNSHKIVKSNHLNLQLKEVDRKTSANGSYKPDPYYIYENGRLQQVTDPRAEILLSNSYTLNGKLLKKVGNDFFTIEGEKVDTNGENPKPLNYDEAYKMEKENSRYTQNRELFTKNPEFKKELQELKRKLATEARDLFESDDKFAANLIAGLGTHYNPELTEIQVSQDENGALLVRYFVIGDIDGTKVPLNMQSINQKNILMKGIFYKLTRGEKDDFWRIVFDTETQPNFTSFCSFKNPPENFVTISPSLDFLTKVVRMRNEFEKNEEAFRKKYGLPQMIKQGQPPHLNANGGLSNLNMGNNNFLVPYQAPNVEPTDSWGSWLKKLSLPVAAVVGVGVAGTGAGFLSVKYQAEKLSELRNVLACKIETDLNPSDLDKLLAELNKPNKSNDPENSEPLKKIEITLTNIIQAIYKLPRKDAEKLDKQLNRFTTDSNPGDACIQMAKILSDVIEKQKEKAKSHNLTV